jgi:hypothetical protein
MQAVVTRLPVREGGTALPNYPGAAREYAYPTAPAADGTAQNAAQNENQAGGTGQGDITPGDVGISTTGN